MTRQIRTTLLTGLFFFGLLTGLQAQDKYEYSIIVYQAGYIRLSVSENGEDYQEMQFKKSDLKGSILGMDLTLLQKKINELANKGWEVSNAYSVGDNHFVYLRKKKNN